jgi:hypothetical protein
LLFREAAKKCHYEADERANRSEKAGKGEELNAYRRPSRQTTSSTIGIAA